MTASFLHRTPASRVVFGEGSIESLADELKLLGVARPMLLAGPRTAASPVFAQVRRVLGDRIGACFERVPAHSSVDVVASLVAQAREARVDGFVAVGGGSVSDTAKAVSLWLAEGGRLEDHATRFEPPDRLMAPELRAQKLPIAAVPMTASAAEVGPGLGIRTPQGTKLLFTDLQLASRLIVIDPKANLAVPQALMLSTGINGLAHCLEGLYSRVRTPGSTALALHGIRLFMRSLPAVKADARSVDARGELLAAAHLSGGVMLNARTCLHHAICHVIGATTGVGHGDANAVLLPAAIAFNAPAAEAELAEAAQAAGLASHGAAALVEHLRALQRALGVPSRLRDLGVDRAVLPAIAAHVMHERGLYFNPRRVESPHEIAALLDSVW
jgi:alcohol dehydrogenase